MKRKRHNDDDDDDDKEEKDRLSDLSNCVLLHILSFLNAIQAVRTCILSKRWNNLWKHLSNLSLHSSYFDGMDGFSEFAAQILSLRDHSSPLYSLRFYSDGTVQPHLLHRILKQAVSHNVQRLRIYFRYNVERIPSCIFSCHSLTSLKLALPSYATILFPDSLNLPELTDLNLWNFVFDRRKNGEAEPFSALKKLKCLTIRFCKVPHPHNLCISSITLEKLTIQTIHTRNYGKIELYTPSLSTFAYAGTPFEKLCGSHLCSIKRVIIDAYMYVNNAEPPSNLLSWLKDFTEITSLTVTLTTLEVLSLVPNLLKHKLYSLRNLKSLRVRMQGISSELSELPMKYAKFVQLPMSYRDHIAKFREAIFKERSLSIRDEIVGFLLQNSHSAEVHILN